MGWTKLRSGATATAHQMPTSVGPGRRAVAHLGGVASRAKPCAECGRWEPTEAVRVLIEPAVASAEMVAEHHAFCSVACLIAWSTRLGGGTPA